MYPLSLRLDPKSYRYFSQRKADPKFATFKDKIFDRDNFTCQFCGFQAKLFLEIVNVDHDYTNNKLSNLATACPFCTQSMFIAQVGIDGFGGGSLIYLPEMNQNHLNSLCHVLFCAITNDTGYKSSAQAIYRALKFRTDVVNEKFGENTSKPSAFGQLILESGVDIEENPKLLQQLRLLPSRTRFIDEIAQWAQAALDELGDEQESINEE